MRRVSSKAAEWADRIKRWRASGEGAAAFAAREGVQAGTLRWWNTELERRARSDSKLSVPIVAVSATWASRPPFEVSLSRGVVVRVPEKFDAEELGRLVRALEAIG